MRLFYLNSDIVTIAIHLKKIYEPAAKSDGYCICKQALAMRIEKEEIHIEKWLKEIGPSAELRKWFNHDAGRWADFAKEIPGRIKRFRRT